jgi:hypothetical protein
MSMDGLGEGMGAGELGDLGLALVRKVFEPGIRAGFHEIGDRGAAIVKSEPGRLRNGVHGRWGDGVTE